MKESAVAPPVADSGLTLARHQRQERFVVVDPAATNTRIGSR